ncbi:DUF192 domain-containing protein [Candidatus Micrarchaeota archaeon]|nr:DUF192 domain-containing protein [Candidatus Micrarchaeota archaeon]
MLFNKSNPQTIMQKVRFANTLWQRFKGLMFLPKKRFDFALIFDFGSETQERASIHMLFVFFFISVVYLDAQKKVVDIKQNLRPGTLFYMPKKKARYLIELPPEKAKEIKLNDTLDWKTV